MTARPRVTPVARVALAVLLVVWLLLAVSTVPGVRPRPGFVPLWDGWVQCSGYVLAAGIAALRAAVRAPHRLLWSLVAAALVLRAFAFIWSIAVLGRPPPYPSLADAGWLLSGLLLVAALWLLVQVHLPRASRTLVLDALLGGLTAAALATALLYPTLVALTAPGIPQDAVATNLAYPVIDVVQLILIAGLLATQSRLPPAAVSMSLGIVILALVDCLYLYLAAVGLFAPGTLLTPLSLGGTALIALAAWLPETGPHGPRLEGAAGLVVPGALAVVCVGVLAYDATHAVPFPGTACAAAGVVLALVRGWATLTADRQAASADLDAKQRELARFRSLVAASSDFIGMADTRGRLVYLNPGGRRLIGMSPDVDVATTTVADYLTPKALEVWRDSRLPQVLAEGHWEGETELRDHRGGPPIPVVTSTFSLRDPVTGEPWLLATVMRDISDRIAAEREVRQLADERQVLLGHLVQAQEDERARIAADVHDDSVQALAAVELRLGLLHREIERHQPDLLPHLDSLRGSVRGATDRLRHLLFDLESPAQRTDLVTALSEAAAYVLEDGVRWTVEGDGGRTLSTAAKVTAYRVAKEAMVNARKHADPHRVGIEVRDVDDGVEVSVVDDGRGFEPDVVDDRPGHLGLPGMRDRAAVAGGRLEIASAPGVGTTVRLWLPTGSSSGAG